MQIIYKNEALGISFSVELISRLFENNRGQKSQRNGQISIFFKSTQIKLHEEALEQIFFKKLSLKVNPAPRLNQEA